MVYKNNIILRGEPCKGSRALSSKKDLNLLRNVINERKQSRYSLLSAYNCKGWNSFPLINPSRSLVKTKVNLPSREGIALTRFSQPLPQKLILDKIPDFSKENWKRFGGIKPPFYLLIEPGYNYLMDLRSYSVLTGSLLGDGSLVKDGYIDISQSLNRKEKVEYLINLTQSLYPVLQAFTPIELRRRSTRDINQELNPTLGPLNLTGRLRTFRFFRPWKKLIYTTTQSYETDPLYYQSSDQLFSTFQKTQDQLSQTDASNFSNFQKIIQNFLNAAVPRERVEGQRSRIMIETEIRSKFVSSFWKEVFTNNLQLSTWIMQDGYTTQSISIENYRSSTDKRTYLAVGKFDERSCHILKQILNENFKLETKLFLKEWNDRRISIERVDSAAPRGKNTFLNQSRLFGYTLPFMVSGFSRKVVPPAFGGGSINIKDVDGFAFNNNGDPIFMDVLDSQSVDKAENTFHAREVYGELLTYFDENGSLKASEKQIRNIEAGIKEKIAKINKDKSSISKNSKTS